MWRKLVQRLVTVLLLSAIAPLVFIPSTSARTRPGELLVPESWSQDHPGPYTIRVALLVDQQWQDQFGADSGSESLSVVNGAGDLFTTAGIRLQVVSQKTWTHSDGATDIQQLYSQLMTMPREDADLTVALAAGYKGPEGGFAGGDRHHALIKHHPYRLDHDTLILAHEVGHTLGLDHHACSHMFCIMSSHYYDKRTHFCPEHLQLLRLNGGYFEYSGQSNP